MNKEEAIYCLKAQSEWNPEVCEECPLYGKTGTDHCSEEALQMATMALQNTQVWVPVNERLPEEHDSIFKKFKGTSKWNPVMFEKTSKYVIATVEYIDGTRLTTRAHTTDGIWKADNSLMTGKVVAWMPLPEPYQESEG